MKPALTETGHATMDLTQCPIHVKEDGSIVALVAQKWTASEPREALTVNGKVVNYRNYLVTEWQEVQLAPPGTAVQTPPSN